MVYSKNAPNQGDQIQNSYSQNKDILKASSTFSLQGDILNIQNLHPTLNWSIKTGSGLGDSFNNYHLGKCLPAEQRTNDHQSNRLKAAVHNKVNNSHSLDKRVKNPYGFKLSIPAEKRYTGIKLGLPMLVGCRRFLIKSKDEITITKNVSGSYSMNNLRSCNCKHCPTCQTKVQIKREKALKDILQNAAGEGFVCIMATYTFSHSLADKIADTKRKIRTLIANLHKSKRIQRLLENEPLPKNCQKNHQTGLFESRRSNQVLPQTTIESAGKIIRYEDRFSEKTGWHSHAHVIYLVKPESGKISDSELKKIENTLFADYQAAAIKRGIKVHRKGFDCALNQPEIISKYFTKTEIEPVAKEYTDILNKTGSDSRSLFQLFDYWEELSQTDTKKADYIKSKIFALSDALKGVRDFIVTPTLAARFAYSPDANKILATDKELISEKEKVSELIVRFTSSIWYQIKQKSLNDYLVHIAKKKGIEGVSEFLCENGVLVCFNEEYRTIELLE